MGKPQPIATVMPKVLLDLGILHATLPDLHRDGFVALTRIEPATGHWQELGAYPAVEPNRFLPGLREFLTRDAYHSVNGLKKARPWKNNPTGLRYYARHQGINVGWYEANWADLDCYKLSPPLTPAQAIAEVQRLVADGVLPQPTITAHSGRGAYAFWYLEGEAGHAVERNRDTESIWQQVQDRLQVLLACLYADTVAATAQTVLRIPGSMHSKAGQKVRYLVALEGDLGGPVGPKLYRLEDLAAALLLPDVDVDVEAVELPPPAQHQLAAPADDQAKHRPPHEPFTIPTKPSRNHQAPPFARLHDLVKLADDRGGFTEGHRKFTLHLVALCARAIGLSPLQAARHFNGYCHPRLPDRDVKDAADLSSTRDYGIRNPVTRQWIKRPRMYRSDKLARALRVTAAEARRLDLVSIMPTAELERRRTEKADAVAKRKTATADHDDRLKARLVQLYAVANPSVRDVAEQLQREGFKVGKSRVAELKPELGITKGTKRGRRPATPELRQSQE